MRLITDHVTVKVPATILGLGSGGDGVACAVAIADTIEVKATTLAQIREDDFTRGLFTALEHYGASLFRPEITVGSRVPKNRGLGRKSSHLLAGLMAAREMLGRPHDFDVLAFADAIGAQPARAKAALSGGCVLGDVQVRSDLKLTLFIPDFAIERNERESVPNSVRYERVRDGINAALTLGSAIGAGVTDREVLFRATEDHIMKMQLALVAPACAALVDWLRDVRLPAAISGDGSTIVCLSEVPSGVAESAKSSGWNVIATKIENSGTSIV